MESTGPYWKPVFNVLEDTFEVSASRMIEAIMAGNFDTELISDLAVGNLKGKKEEPKKALLGNVQEHHRFMIQASLDHIEFLEKIIAGLDQEINRKLKDYHQEYELLQTIPGVKE